MSLSDLALHRVIGRGDEGPPSAPASWVRPSEWPDIESLIGPTDDKFVALVAVPDNTDPGDGVPFCF
jgi:hypothetical protein